MHATPRQQLRVCVCTGKSRAPLAGGRRRALHVAQLGAGVQRGAGDGAVPLGGVGVRAVRSSQGDGILREGAAAAGARRRSSLRGEAVAS